jgi:hypothetical protein
LRVILRGLLAALGAWRLQPAQGVAVHGRISRAFGRIARLLVRFRAGTLSRRAVPPVAQLGVAPKRAERQTHLVALPRKFGWLVQAGGYQAAGYGLQLQTVLNTPEMAELLATSEQARRVLRPLCRALAIELPWVIDKIRMPRPPRQRKPRPKPEPFLIPLPRGVLSAARRQGFGKIY